MDDEDRENEGDLCVAAERVTPEHINFMATHGRGLICLSLTEHQCEQLGLPMMVRENRAPLGTAFTVSIDAARPGGSPPTAPRDPTAIRSVLPADIVTPITSSRCARRGGVRAGPQTESVDRPGSPTPRWRLRDRGTTAQARLPDLEAFARRHNLKIATVADLIAYRSANDKLVHCVAEAPLSTSYGGPFRALVYTTDIDDNEHLVLVKGDVSGPEPVLVRPHLEYLPGDIFGYAPRDTRTLMHRSMERIAAEGRGVILYLRRSGRGLDVFDVPEGGSPKAPSTGFASPRASIFRDFGIGAQILRDIGVRKIRWLTNNPLRLVSLPGYGLEIVEWVPLSDTAGARPAEPAPSKVVPLR